MRPQVKVTSTLTKLVRPAVIVQEVDLSTWVYNIWEEYKKEIDKRYTQALLDLASKANASDLGKAAPRETTPDHQEDHSYSVIEYLKGDKHNVLPVNKDLRTRGWSQLLFPTMES